MKWIARRHVIAWSYGLTCHSLFAVAVAAMVFEMAFGMSRAWGSLSPPVSYLANAILLAQFPVVHSCLLTHRGRKWLARLAPFSSGPALATTTYAMIASAQVCMLFLMWSPSGIIWWSARGWPLVLSLTAYAGSWLLLVKAVVDAGASQQLGLLGWWALSHDRPPRFGPMPRRGLFRFCRQPIYLAFALTLWTVPTWSPDQLAMACVLTAYCALGPIFKERRYEQAFGADFTAYRNTVPYWLPRLPSRSHSVTTEISADEQSVYREFATLWWSGETRWLRLLHNLVPARFGIFDRTLPIWSELAVLDLGCGGGFMSEELARRGAHVIGVDPCEAVIAAARAHAGTSGLAIDYRVGAGEALPLPDHCVDAVICVDVLEHVANVPQVLAEARRVLRPKGHFFFDTVNRTWIAEMLLVTWGERILRIVPKGTHDPRKFLCPEELDRQLRRAGFEPGRTTGLGPVGVDVMGDIKFGPWPSPAMIYAGHARAV